MLDYHTHSSVTRHLTILLIAFNSEILNVTRENISHSSRHIFYSTFWKTPFYGAFHKDHSLEPACAKAHPTLSSFLFCAVSFSFRFPCTFEVWHGILQKWWLNIQLWLKFHFAKKFLHMSRDDILVPLNRHIKATWSKLLDPFDPKQSVNVWITLSFILILDPNPEPHLAPDVNPLLPGPF